MTRVEIEIQLIDEIHYLPVDVMEAMLKLALSIKNLRVNKNNHAIESAWEKEIAERVSSVDKGIAEGIDFDAVINTQEDKLTVLRSALIAGENSGVVENYSLANLLAELDAEELV
jgi:hypothetical protein